MDDEGILVEAAADGNEGAFRVLVDRHYDACLRYATRLLGNRPDAEDAVQETFVRAYRSLGAYRERGRFRGWLFQILVNRCRSHARQGSRRDALLSSGDAIEEREPAAGEPRQGSSFGVEVRRAMAALPERLREAFLLKFVEEWTYEEMSEMTGASVSALKMRVARARESLREQLGGVADD